MACLICGVEAPTPKPRKPHPGGRPRFPAHSAAFYPCTLCMARIYYYETKTLPQLDAIAHKLVVKSRQVMAARNGMESLEEYLP